MSFQFTCLIFGRFTPVKGVITNRDQEQVIMTMLRSRVKSATIWFAP